MFDWGEMPDQLKMKGRALAVMAAFNFEELAKRGIHSHYRGLVSPRGKVIGFSDLAEKMGKSGMSCVALFFEYAYKFIKILRLHHQVNILHRP